MLEAIITSAGLVKSYGEAMLADLSDEQWTQIPEGVAMHPASIVGHVATSYGFGAAMLAGQEPSPPEGWMELFGPSAAAQADATYPPKETLLSVLNDTRAQVIEGLRTATPETLAQPIEDEQLREVFPTIGAVVIALLTVHESTHWGQLSAWRRAMGMELPI